jgi:hypothetical protein
LKPDRRGALVKDIAQSRGYQVSKSSSLLLVDGIRILQPIVPAVDGVPCQCG